MKRWVLLALMAPMVAYGGKKDKAPKTPAVDADHANHFRDVPPTGAEIKVGVTDAWARDAEAKAKVIVENGTSDYLVFDVGEMRVKLGAGEYVPNTGLRGDFAVVKPRGSANRVLTLTGSGMHVDAATVVPSGIQRVAADAPTHLAEDFKLPLEKPGVKAGPYDCVVPDGKIKKETDELIVRFKCRYDGAGLGLVNPTSVQIRTEDGQLFANEDRDLDPKIVRQGDEFKFDVAARISAKIVDMQFATLHLVWNDTFREGQPVPVEVPPIELALDPGLTASKNQ